MTPLPYVGVSGLMSRAAVDACLAAFEQAFPHGDHLLMVGVLASQKTVAGVANKHPRRYPRVPDVADIFADHPRLTLNLVHYASDTQPTLPELRDLASVAGHLCEGFQFNVTWPHPEVLAVFQESWGGWPPASQRFVLQAGRLLLNGVVDLVRALRPYRGLVTDVLLDASGGRGLPLDVELERAAVSELLAADLGMGISVAGGLCAEGMPEIAPLLRDFPCLSIDAEGRLRTPEDDLDLDRVRAYLAAAGGMMGGRS